MSSVSGLRENSSSSTVPSRCRRRLARAMSRSRARDPLSRRARDERVVRAAVPTGAASSAAPSRRSWCLDRFAALAPGLLVSHLQRPPLPGVHERCFLFGRKAAFGLPFLPDPGAAGRGPFRPRRPDSTGRGQTQRTDERRAFRLAAQQLVGDGGRRDSDDERDHQCPGW
jgi:hypothetical protein